MSSRPAAAALGGIAATAWIALVLGVGGHHMSLAGGLLMIAAMMLPPEIISVARNNRGPFVAVATGAVWTGFVLAALSGGALVHASGRLGGIVGSAVLVGAGAYQLSPVKQRLVTAMRQAPAPVWRHALRCLGSCWALMLVMFVAGAGGLGWMAVLTGVMLAERAVRPDLVPRLTGLSGAALIIAGLQAAGHHH
jgi:predicted metal-binding membrane protein